MSNSTTNFYNYKDNVNLISGILTFVIGVFGAICNYTIVHVFIVSPDKTSFNLICFFRALINFYILVTTFLGVFLPSTLLGYSVYSQAFESWNLNLSMSLYLGNEYQITLVALNRFCALFFPRYYTKIFAIRPTLFVIIVFYVYRLAVVIYMTAVDVARGCFYFFSTITLAWQYPFDPVCWFEDNIMIIVLTTFIGTTCLNMVTFVRILKFYRSMNTHDRDTRTRARKNAMLFFQTVLQDSLYIIDLSFTFKLGALSTHRMWTSISGTLVWESLHALDGFVKTPSVPIHPTLFRFIMLMFNDRFSFLCARNESPETSTSAVPRRAPVHPLGSVG
ncbi:CRE-SRX-89 protein [Caenorhabditis remanei]|uniref:CRE-SRX-89 protein n=1 Tax=Caenorhabditis remanei TaxID=31234 RepID=E3LPM2_CAERE|nr:CRE-SRX-89 protein [Caenorhabditis remanei]